jgi:hypothetical protein
MGIDIPSAMDALRELAVARRAKTPQGDMPLFNRSFLKTVQMFGRTYDLAMVAAHKIGTRTYMKDTDKFPTMVKKRKIALLPPRGADRKTAKQIFQAVRRKEKSSS